MRIEKDDPVNITNEIRVLDADDHQMGCLYWVDLVSHDCEQVVLGEPKTDSEGHWFRPPLTNSDGTVKTQIVKYKRIEITARPAQS